MARRSQYRRENPGSYGAAVTAPAPAPGTADSAGGRGGDTHRLPSGGAAAAAPAPSRSQMKFLTAEGLRQFLSTRPGGLSMSKYGQCNGDGGWRSGYAETGFFLAGGLHGTSKNVFVLANIDAMDELRKYPHGTPTWQAVERRQLQLLHEAAADVPDFTLPDVRMTRTALSDEPNGGAIIVGTAAELDALLLRTERARSQLEAAGISLHRSSQFMMQAVPLTRLLECLHTGSTRDETVRSLFFPPAVVSELGADAAALPAQHSVRFSLHSHIMTFVSARSLHERIERHFARIGEEPYVLVYWEGTEGAHPEMQLSLLGGKRKPGERSKDAAIRRAGLELWCGAHGVAERLNRRALTNDDLEAAPLAILDADSIRWHVFKLKNSLPDWHE
ncbi:MAG: hypothetical protein EOO65_02575 [Methanosarcinales archaeon]|nr:MAG: hypothetical protein EOO65_02575 [Methanosarcinales archaeon]